MDRSIDIRRGMNGVWTVTLFVGDPDDFMAEGELRRFGLVDQFRTTISEKDAEAITSYEEVVGFDPETGEAIWGEVIND